MGLKFGPPILPSLLIPHILAVLPVLPFLPLLLILPILPVLRCLTRCSSRDMLHGWSWSRPLRLGLVRLLALSQSLAAERETMHQDWTDDVG
jgi:hypothetical protein